MFANCILVATFFSLGTLVLRKKTWRYRTRKILEFSQLKIDILVYVSCKFEMSIFKIAQVICENKRIAFLYVLSILTLIGSLEPEAHRLAYRIPMVRRPSVVVVVFHNS